MSLLGPKVPVSPVGNERPGWDPSPSSDMSFITLTLNGGNDEHFSRVITHCVPLMSEGKRGAPSFNIWLFFLCNLVQFIIWAFHSLARWHLSNVDVLITGLWYCVSLWCPISSSSSSSCPNFGHSECRKLCPHSVLQLFCTFRRERIRRALQMTYLNYSQIMIRAQLDNPNICF